MHTSRWSGFFLRLWCAPLRGYDRLGRSLGRLGAAQLLTLGFLSYVVVGVALLSLPIAQRNHVGLLDNLFSVTSAVSTTGLVTVSVGRDYSFFGQLVLVCLFQAGGIGYMTISSFIVMARGRPLSSVRAGVLRAGFALPEGLDLSTFVRNVVLFTLVIESVGVAVLYGEFRAAGVAAPLWSAVFHCVSAFATAGFGLYDDSLTRFAGNPVVCGTIAALCYLGAIGFIVIQDAWRAARLRDYHVTFTSKVILGMTAAIFLVAAPLLYAVEPGIRDLPPAHGWLAAAFQIMTASTTAGFNTVPIGALSHAALVLVVLVMIVGASPSGTGGGIKTTTVSSLLAILSSTVRGRGRVTFFGHEIPSARLLSAVGAATLYLTCLAGGVLLLCVVETADALALAFEAASAIGTVGLSMGVTGGLSAAGKVVVVLLMFVGRVGPLTIGLALFHGRGVEPAPRRADLAV